MLIRRIRDHVAQQNWTAVAIDFVIVVAGVFVATQVSNWNSNRLDQQRAQSYLVRIQANLRADHDGLEKALAYWTDVIRYGEAAIAYAEHGRLEEGSPWRTVLAFYQASQLLPFRMDTTTYDELKSAGDLELIGSSQLRDALAAHYVTGPLSSTPYLLRYNPEYRSLVRGYTPLHVADHILKHCVVRAGGQDEAFKSDCTSPMLDAEAQAILDGYLAVPDLVPGLRFWITNQKIASALVRVAIKNTVELERRVAAEID